MAMRLPTSQRSRDYLARVTWTVGPPGSPGRPWPARRADGSSGGLPRLAVRLVAAAVRAVLLQLEPVGVVTPVLAGDVVAVLALLAGQRDLGPNICRSHDGVPFSRNGQTCQLADTPCVPQVTVPKDSVPRNRRVSSGGRT